MRLTAALLAVVVFPFMVSAESPPDKERPKRSTMRVFLHLGGLALDTPTNPKRRELKASIHERLERRGNDVDISVTRITSGALVVAGHADYDNGECLVKGDVWFHKPKASDVGGPSETSTRLQLVDARRTRTPFAGPYDCSEELTRLLLSEFDALLAAHGDGEAPTKVKEPPAR